MHHLRMRIITGELHASFAHAYNYRRTILPIKQIALSRAVTVVADTLGMADVSAAQSTVSKRLKLLGDLSKCRKQLEKELPKYFEEYYGSVSDLELCDSSTAVLTLNVKDESGKRV